MAKYNDAKARHLAKGEQAKANSLQRPLTLEEREDMLAADWLVIGRPDPDGKVVLWDAVVGFDHTLNRLRRWGTRRADGSWTKPKRRKGADHEGWTGVFGAYAQKHRLYGFEIPEEAKLGGINPHGTNKNTTKGLREGEEARYRLRFFAANGYGRLHPTARAALVQLAKDSYRRRGDDRPKPWVINAAVRKWEGRIALSMARARHRVVGEYYQEVREMAAHPGSGGAGGGASSGGGDDDDDDGDADVDDADDDDDGGASTGAGDSARDGAEDADVGGGGDDDRGSVDGVDEEAAGSAAAGGAAGAGEDVEAVVDIRSSDDSGDDSLEAAADEDSAGPGDGPGVGAPGRSSGASREEEQRPKRKAKARGRGGMASRSRAKRAELAR